MESHIVLFIDPELYEGFVDLVTERTMPHPRHEREVAKRIIKAIDQAEAITQMP